MSDKRPKVQQTEKPATPEPDTFMGFPVVVATWLPPECVAITVKGKVQALIDMRSP